MCVGKETVLEKGGQAVPAFIGEMLPPTGNVDEIVLRLQNRYHFPTALTFSTELNC